MEDNIQTIIVIIISMFILFIFPVYLAYEKKDDISYALAIRYTQTLVDDVRSKGYLTREMYQDYKAKLKLTGNAYDIDMTHEYNRYDPITNYYKITIDGAGNKKYTLVKTTTQQEKNDYEKWLITTAVAQGKLSSNATKQTKQEYINKKYKDEGIDKVENTYLASKEIYKTEHIESVLAVENKLNLNASSSNFSCDDIGANCKYAYIMNVDDNFNIKIKNTNTTLATVVYNMVTANTLDENTRIYVNYGGAILSSKWYNEVDYAKMKHDNISLTKTREIDIFTEERKFYENEDGGYYPVENINEDYTSRYAIEFFARPEATTELREKGIVTVEDYSGYNFAVGNNTINNKDYMMSISVGLNGVTLIANKTPKLTIADSGATFYLPKDTVYISSGYGTTTQRQQRYVTDYYQMRIRCVSKGKLKIECLGKKDVPNYTSEISISDTEYILENLDITINNPKAETVTKMLGTANNNRGTKISCSINMTSSNSIKITASKYVSQEQTLLSYPTTINDYVKIKVEFTKTPDNCYIANLYINDTNVAQSMELGTIPRVNVVGKTFIGNEERFFYGDIKKAKIYELW